ncbi:BAG family molecular chaperone regulator 1 isoform X1 [Eurytemora carolleeae]|uniref:BAG family molecular chaperone regulator 1 isoform X1 n=1 Tax=Eurytemora carolleeae TaxID=1294199 RepID=UPI000C7669A0|nr:BAG family molecular chaperone regulator 1 isoform X1 [Eurytemora carolleeae]|eukprot:XP_023326223.1 BAG family molecular chaperone regulator 1-like isoform X1 [Eurytemora affinis]
MVDVVVKHNGKSYNVNLTQDATTDELFTKLNSETGVPIKSMRIIFNGKQISKDSTQTISQSGICSGSKIMLLGKKYDPAQEPSYKDILNLETKALLVETKYIKLLDELDGVVKGHLDKTLQPEALKSMEKRSKGVNEELQRILENLDSVSILEDQTEIRNKRKSVVSQVSKIMDQNEDYINKINQYRQHYL